MNLEKYKIAVCVDFTTISENAFKESLKIARKTGDEIVLIHVNTDREKTEKYFAEKILKMIQDAGTAANGIDISFRIIPGKKSEIIERLCQTIDLIHPLYVVVGYQIKTGLDRFIGPNIQKIIFNTNFPVIAIKEGETLGDLSKLVFPLDLSIHSRQKTNISIRFAKDVNASIELLSLRVDNTGKDDVNLKVITRQTEEKFTESEVPYTQSWIEGHNEHKIVLDYAHESNASIIAAVFESDPDLIERLTGNDDEKLLAQTDMPLLIVKTHHSPHLW